MNAPEAPSATSAQTPTMHIGALAERTGMSLRTLRHYDETGLLEPSGRTEGGFRLYTERDLSRLLVIRRMKPLGFSLDEMADLLDVVDQLRAGAGDAGTRDAGAGDAGTRNAGTGTGSSSSSSSGAGSGPGPGPGDSGTRDAGTSAEHGATGGAAPGDGRSHDVGDLTTQLRARLDAYVESAEARRAELARKLDMADEFIGLLRST